MLELSIGCSTRASAVALTKNAVSVTDTPWRAAIGLYCSRRAKRSVTSISWKESTCGTACHAAVMFSAVRLRTPRKAIRVPAAGTSRSTCGEGAGIASAGALFADPAEVTSASTIRPPGPLPVIVPRSTPRLRASARVDGVASGRFTDGAGRSVTAVADVPSSTTMSTSPTEITEPTSPPRATTVPVTGAGISTTALSVSISTTGWSSTTRSPTATSHLTTSASVSPSPMSANRNSCCTVKTPRCGGWRRRRGRRTGRSGPRRGASDTARPTPRRGRSALAG